jgi:RNA polymerase sigma factor (sigma-70 family)
MTSTNASTFWQNAYQNHAPKLLGLCHRYVADRSIAEDLMHDAFMTAIKKQDTYTNKGSFEGWLSRITVNTVLMYLRKQKKWTESIDSVDISDDNAVEIDEYESPKFLILNSDFQQEDLLLAIDLLPIHHKTVFNLYVFENFSHQQIAENLNISAGTSKSHLARARKKIQEILLKKAIEMKKKERKMAIVPFFNKENHFIDELYKQQLDKLSITPSHTPMDFQQLLQQPHSPTPPTPASWLGSYKMLLLASGVIIIGGIALSLYAFQPKKEQNLTIQNTENQHFNTKNDFLIENKKLTEQQISNVDTSSKTKEITKVKNVEKPKQNKEKIAKQDIENIEKQTFIVKKQVVKKDTLFK